MLIFVSVCLLSLSGVWSGGGPVFTQEKDGSGKIAYTPPDLNNDNAHSTFLPDRLRCEGCKAVAYQVMVNFIYKICWGQ